MIRSFLSKWRVRYSLKTFLSLITLSGVVVVWLAVSYRHYLVEQQLIESVAKQMHSGAVLHVSGERRPPSKRRTLGMSLF